MRDPVVEGAVHECWFGKVRIVLRGEPHASMDTTHTTLFRMEQTICEHVVSQLCCTDLVDCLPSRSSPAYSVVQKPALCILGLGQLAFRARISPNGGPNLAGDRKGGM